MNEHDLVYITENKTKILVKKGRKGPDDFVVKYQELGKRVRTPQHIHLIVDLFAKRTGNLALTNELIDHVIYVIKNLQANDLYPPKLQIYSNSDADRFEILNQYGEYPVDFLLIVSELIMIQEKTNYPTGTLNLKLFQQLRNGADIFSIVSTASFRGG